MYTVLVTLNVTTIIMMMMRRRIMMQQVQLQRLLTWHQLTLMLFLPIHRVINQDSEDLYLCPFFSERRAYFVIWHTTAYYLGVLYICVI